MSEWLSDALLNVLSLVLDFRGRTPKKLGMEWGGGDIPALSANNVEMGQINFAKECYFGSDALYKMWMTRGDAQIGDVVLTTEAPLGNVAQIPDSQRYILSQRAILLRADESKLSNDYLAHYLRSDRFQNLMRQQSSGTTATGIQRKKLETLPIRFPSSRLEQSKIAEIISIVDRAVQQTEALIAKEQRIKTGLMQDLLTRGIDEHGNVRTESTHKFKDSLVGRIPIEWRAIQIGDVTSLQRGHDITENDLKPGSYPVVSSSGVIGFHNEFTSKGPNVVVGRKGTIGKVHYLENNFWAHDTSLYVTTFKGNNPRYIYFLFTHLNLARFGTKSGSPSLNRNDIHPIWIGSPSPTEQLRIANALAKRNEAEALAFSKLTKMKYLKAALMQDLLTEKKRVTLLLEQEVLQ